MIAKNWKAVASSVQSRNIETDIAMRSASIVRKMSFKSLSFKVGTALLYLCLLSVSISYGYSSLDTSVAAGHSMSRRYSAAAKKGTVAA